VGDLLLVEAAERLEKCIRPGDLVARLGGDEFTIVVDENSKHSGSRIISERIIEAFKKPFVFGGQKPVMSPSIGISMYPEHAADYGTMMQYADTAMYQAKEKGGNCYLYYSPEMGDKLTHHMNIEAGLRRALEEEEFVLHYQPKVEISTGKIVGMEALIRWMDPEKGMVSPNDFIPLAEETGLIIPIGEWVLRKACEQCLEWGKTDIEIAINLSANHLYDPSLLIMLQTTLQETGFPPGRLEIEITENGMMRNVQQTITILEQIKSLGVKVAIDDFGTGYSSLSYLKRFAIDTIKIDRSFVSGIPHNADEVAITSATVVMAQNLKRRVIAEGIETEEQAAFLNQLGCEMGQGYYYSRPLPSAEIAAMLSNSHYLSWPKPKLINKKQ
jgi:EAL domain-containing protein (putative c-di-GMP-specific phosphodiesterase class I)